MLEEPTLHDNRIMTCLQDDYGVMVAQITSLPLAVDRNTAVYRVVAVDGAAYFLKLRSGAFDETSVALPRFLRDQGIEQIIAPLPTRTGRLWADLGACKAILTPFMAGRDGYQVRLAERQWRELGVALKKLHITDVPPALAEQIRREAFSPRWRQAVRAFLGRAEVAYYRYERVVEDIGVFCERVWLGSERVEDREQFVRCVAASFQPGGTIEMARRSDRAR